jgi:hypothetical protein
MLQRRDNGTKTKTNGYLRSLAEEWRNTRAEVASGALLGKVTIPSIDLLGVNHKYALLARSLFGTTSECVVRLRGGKRYVNGLFTHPFNPGCGANGIVWNVKVYGAAAYSGSLCR